MVNEIFLWLISAITDICNLTFVKYIFAIYFVLCCLGIVSNRL